MQRASTRRFEERRSPSDSWPRRRDSTPRFCLTERVIVLDEHYDASSSVWAADLRFGHFDGAFETIDLNGRDLTGAHLDGSFVTGSLAGADFLHARLARLFALMNCQDCILTNARLSGTFFRVDFGEAD